MRKILKLATALMLILVFLLPSFAYARQEDSYTITEDEELAFKQACLAHCDSPNGCTLEDVHIEFVGKFDGVLVGFVHEACSVPCADPCDQMIHGLNFHYCDCLTMSAYRDGEVVQLPEAWELGWFTTEGLERLHFYYTYGFEKPDELLTEPYPMTTAQEQAFKEAYLQKYHSGDGCTEEDVHIQFFGEYDGVLVGRVRVSGFAYAESFWEDKKDGLPFRYMHLIELTACRDGQVLALEEAWQQGWFTEEGIERLYLYDEYGFWLPDTGDGIWMAVSLLLFSLTGLAWLGSRRKQYQ